MIWLAGNYPYNLEDYLSQLQALPPGLFVNIVLKTRMESNKSISRDAAVAAGAVGFIQERRNGRLGIRTGYRHGVDRRAKMPRYHTGYG
ncbi:hypothetical protein [Taibaiella helva]|uniref:hypothetical protein n=1 Tax=Taibaiella helva TaxID=2301235 RepID=UPI0018E4DCC3|nr:hypothetical protein [Taibaiella helva]